MRKSAILWLSRWPCSSVLVVKAPKANRDRPVLKAPRAIRDRRALPEWPDRKASKGRRVPKALRATKDRRARVYTS